MRKSRLVALVAGIVVIAVPSVVMGAIISREGGPPTRVYMQKQPGESVWVDENGANVMEQQVDLGATSHLIVSFTSEWGRLDISEEALLSFYLDGESDTQEWGIAGTRITRTSGTWTWVFYDVPAGSHTLQVSARIDATPPGSTQPREGSADANDPVLTVTVIPPL